MSKNQGLSTLGTVIITSIVAITVTVAIGSVIISQYGRETVAKEVSPFVETAKNLVATSTTPKEPATEGEVIMDGVAKNQASSVLIYKDGSTEPEFLGRGILVSSNGYIITDASIINASSTYSIAIAGTKERATSTVVKIEDELAVLKISISTSLVSAFGLNIPAENDVVVAVTGDAKMRIGTGIVTNVADKTITTNIYGNIVPGSVLVAKSGFAVGISTASNQKAGEPNFRLLTKSDISRLTTPVDGQY